MSPADQRAAFAGALFDLVQHFSNEFDLDSVSVLGMLRMQMRAIEDDLIERSEKGEPP